MRSLVLTGVLALGSVAGVASADQWCLSYIGYGSNVTAGLSYDASKSWDSATRSSFWSLKVGEHRFTAYGSEYDTFCVQVFEPLIVGTSVCFDVVSPAQVPDYPPSPGPMGAVRAALVQDLFARFHAFATNNAVDADTRNVRCAAFQMAVYELSHENFDAATAGDALAQIDLTGGAFQVNGSDSRSGAIAAYGLAIEMLDALGSGGFKSLGANLLGLTNPDFQDQLVVVPIPATLGLAAVGLVLGGVMRRRQLAKA